MFYGFIGICRASIQLFMKQQQWMDVNYWQKLFKITIPLVKPQLTISTILNIIYVFNSFPIIWTMTKGDPASKTDTIGYIPVQTGILQW